MKPQEYSATETNLYRVKRQERTKTFKKQMKGRGTPILINYPENATQSQRGFTPSGSAKLNFPEMLKADTKPPKPITFGISNSSRKPTKGTKYYLQVVKTKKDDKKEKLPLTISLKVPAAFNKKGDMIRPGFTHNKPIIRRIQHQITPRKVG